jgi:hypothetical protein
MIGNLPIAPSLGVRFFFAASARKTVRRALASGGVPG